jgi:hypothetical protein
LPSIIGGWVGGWGSLDNFDAFVMSADQLPLTKASWEGHTMQSPWAISLVPPRKHASNSCSRPGIAIRP